MYIRDRIKELRRVEARELMPNAKNWRTHPESQKNALRGILAEVGFADALLARELPDGRLALIDGHLRAETTPDQKVPVLVLDVNEEEADKLLATLDPLAMMAGKNDALYGELISMVQTENTSVQSLLDTVLASHGENLSAALAELGSSQLTISEGFTSGLPHDEGAFSADKTRQNGASGSDSPPAGYRGSQNDREVNVPELFQVVVSCEGEDHQRETYETLTASGYVCRLITL